ncbi:hypothetical protein [uncultured Pontibacter sp.]|uniref:hypothetical protein n=1 Tax=uncultured Pontibacter sp. TaxID=453356 RepID=UPI002614FDA1|nr:hypothetical protein [uncultured Pontibacter sp.]
MKKVLYVFAMAGFFGFASCDSPAEERAEDRVEEMEDQAEETADQLEDAAEDADTTVIE